MASGLSPYLPYLAAILLFVLIVVMVATIVVVRRIFAPPARKPDDKLEIEPERELRRSRQSLRAGLKRLAGVEAVPDHPYTVPWIVLIGPPAAGIAGIHQAVDPAEPGDPAANTIAG